MVEFLWWDREELKKLIQYYEGPGSVTLKATYNSQDLWEAKVQRSYGQVLNIAKDTLLSNRVSGSVSVISTATNTVTATITVGSDPYGVAVTPDGAYAYVTNANGNTVSVISTSSNTVTATVTVGSNPFGVAVTPDGAYAYVTNWGDNTVDVGSTAAGNFVYPEYLYGGLLALTACFGAFALFSKRKNLPSFNSKKTDYN